MFDIIITILSLGAVYASETVIIVTSKGSIQGYTNEGYNTFFGVPYAKVDEDNPFGVSDHHHISPETSTV